MRPPFRHRATVERNVEAGTDGWGGGLPPRFEAIGTELACDYWASVEKIVEGPDVNALIEASAMLVPVEADVAVRDEISEIRNRAGRVLQDKRLRVTADVARVSHRRLTLEVITAHREAGALS